MKITTDHLRNAVSFLILLFVGVAALNNKDQIEIREIPMNYDDQIPFEGKIKDTETQENIENIIEEKPTRSRYATVKKGQTIYAIARENGLIKQVSKIKRLNKCGKCDKIKVGQRIRLY